MMEKQFRFYTVVGNGLVMLILLSAVTVFAHGGGVLQLANVPAGPYLLSVWLDPADVITARPFHVTVGINQMSADTTRPVLDAEVLVELYLPGARHPSASATATTEQSNNKLLYEADLQMEEAGSYAVRLTVRGEDGAGSAEFNLVINEARPHQQLTWMLAIPGVIVAWLVWRRRNKLLNSREKLPSERRTFR